VFSFAIVLSGAELFTNGIEWLGRRIALGEGAVGSLLAAVATALPETLIPIVAVIEGGRDRRTSRSAPSSAHRSCSRPLRWS
jgi:cation:H+ antiporter